MSDLLEKMQKLVAAGEVRISEHGYDELTDDGLTAREAVAGIAEAIVIEEYPDFPKGPSILVLQKAHDGAPFHAVWGIPKGHAKPAVLVTAYRPDPAQWDEDLMKRRQS